MELVTGIFLGANQALSRRVGEDEVAAGRKAGLHVMPADFCAAESHRACPQSRL